MDKIFRKDIEAELRARIKREETSAGSYRVNGKKSMNTVLKKLTLTETIELLQKEFESAAEKFGVSVEDIRFDKPESWSGESLVLTAVRLETDEEMETRLRRATDVEVYRRRRIKEDKVRAKYQKKKKIEELKKELEKLQA